MPRLVVFGAGELGGRVAESYAMGVGEVVAFTRTAQRHAALRKAGVHPAVGSPAGALRSDDLLLLALPGNAAQREAVQALAAAGDAPARVVMISSTGYYGQVHGYVDEDTPPGVDEHSRAVADAEAVFRAWAGGRGVVLRTGGLYRSGRGPLSALEQRGAAPLGPPDRTLSLVHYDDAASAARAALLHPAPESTYLVVTPPCPTRSDFYTAACIILQLALPLFDAPLGRPPAEYDVSRLNRDLLPVPAWPRWQAALVP